ncbi:hypothetical protein [Paenibacillus campinasensis]|uniref:Uncharacterized protein n=1 Tax=Paenibacillus campinasensis TaxID=66347 RepID=A0A268ELF0_9BACL|nr:hypothetical protein [Paenibacillus campinasensis]PAD73940.1 hypothetical protein CHH67_19080 [Paenibacillus campinasensis]
MRHIPNKKHALTAALQAGAARDFALIKSRRQFKRGASDKPPYKPGGIGPSGVAERIKSMFNGVVLSRKDRRQWAKDTGTAFRPFYSESRG